MGVRIAFYKTTNGKSLVENFSRTFSDFREWILTENKKSITEYNERIISPGIESFLEQSENEIIIKSISQKLPKTYIPTQSIMNVEARKGKINVKSKINTP